MSDKWIRASEISGYVYCSRSWWLQRIQGRVSHNVQELERGRRHHQQHGQLLQRSVLSRWLAYALLFAVVALATFQILANNFG